MVVQVVSDAYSSSVTVSSQDGNDEAGNRKENSNHQQSSIKAKKKNPAMVAVPTITKLDVDKSGSSPDEMDLSDSGEEELASVPNKSEKSLSPECLLNAEVNSNSSSSRSSAVSSSSSSSSKNMLVVSQLQLYCNGQTSSGKVSPLRISAVKEIDSTTGTSSSEALLLSPPLPYEEAAEAESQSRVETNERLPPSAAYEEDEANQRRHTPPTLANGSLKTDSPITSSTSPSSSKSPPSNRSSISCSSASSAIDQLKRKHSLETRQEDLCQNSSSIEKRHKCDICGKGFPYMSILESHKRCHTGEKPFSCHFCDKKFAQKATLQVHERTHTGEKPYKCKYCEKTFAQYGTKTVHEKSAHLGIRNYKCPKCSKCLSSPSALYTHKKTHGDKSFQCNFCPKTFTLKNYLKLHIKQVHEHNERKHICKFCSKTFAYAGSLQVHVRTHTGERPYMCKFCPKAFASQGNLQSHERTHTGERPYTCDHCGRSFIQKSQLTAHEATHSYLHGPSHAGAAASELQEDEEEVLMEGNECHGMSTLASPTSHPFAHTSQALLSAAAAINGGYRKQNEFVCKFCGKRYAYASSLYVHTRLHTGERPFRCNFCDKSFTNQGNMQVHQRVHTGEKPYKCEACGKSYAQKVGLKIHQEQCQVHLNRRGSVMTVATNESSPSVTEDDVMVVHRHEGFSGNLIVSEDEKHSTASESLNHFLNGAMQSHHHHQASMSSPSQTSSVFSSPIHSQRSSFSEAFSGVVPSSAAASFFEAQQHSRTLNHNHMNDVFTHHHPHNNNVLGLKLPVSSVSLNGQFPTNTLLQQHPDQSTISSALAAAIAAPPTTPTTPQAVASLASLLLEQLNESHHHQQQLAALKALMELSASVGGLVNPNSIPSSANLAQPQPVYPQQQQPTTPYSLLNSQIHQQLLNQLLFPVISQQQQHAQQLSPFSSHNTQPILNFNLNNNNSCLLPLVQPPSQAPDSLQSAQQLAAATALADFSKQQHLNIEHHQQQPSH